MVSGLRTTALVLIAIGVVGLFALAAFVTWYVARWVRLVRTHVARVFPQGMAGPAPTSAAMVRSRVRRTSLSARKLASVGPQRQSLALRRDLWTHVDAAEVAVTTARAAGAPIGELGTLQAQLRDLAVQYDRHLALLPMHPSANALARAGTETAEIVAQADLLCEATIDALHAASASRAGGIRTWIGQEAQAVQAGSAQLRSLPPS